MTRHFDAGFNGEGFTLFEHWENDGRDLLLVTSDFTAIGSLKPGDHIVKRTWTAAGVPVIVNCAAPKPWLLTLLTHGPEDPRKDRP